jgi:hypothetical protein
MALLPLVNSIEKITIILVKNNLKSFLKVKINSGILMVLSSRPIRIASSTTLGILLNKLKNRKPIPRQIMPLNTQAH